MKKNVLAKCYGGDISRKRKLLEKHKKEGKEENEDGWKCRNTTKAFLSVLKTEK